MSFSWSGVWLLASLAFGVITSPDEAPKDEASKILPDEAPEDEAEDNLDWIEYAAKYVVENFGQVVPEFAPPTGFRIYEGYRAVDKCELMFQFADVNDKGPTYDAIKKLFDEGGRTGADGRRTLKYDPPYAQAPEGPKPGKIKVEDTPLEPKGRSGNKMSDVNQQSAAAFFIHSLLVAGTMFKGRGGVPLKTARRCGFRTSRK